MAAEEEDEKKVGGGGPREWERKRRPGFSYAT